MGLGVGALKRGCNPLTNYDNCDCVVYNRLAAGVNEKSRNFRSSWKICWCESKSQESVGAPFNNLNFFVRDHPFSTFARLLYLYMLFLLFHQYFDVYLWFSHRQKSAPSEFFPITFVKHSRTARATDWLVLLYFVNMKLTNFFPIFSCDPRRKLKTLRL